MSAEEREVRIISKDAISNQLQELKELKKIEAEKQKLLGNTKNGKKSGKGKESKKTSEFQDLKKDIDDLKRKQSELEKNITKAVEIGNDPVGFLKSKIFDVLKIAGPLSVVTIIVDKVIERIQKEFSAGGRFDVRKIVQDAVREFLKIELIVARDRGEVFFGTSQNLTQGAPEFSNTERLQDGRIRDLERNFAY